MAALFLLCGALSLVYAQGAPAPAGSLVPTKIDIRATPIEAFDPREPAKKQFGSLIFRGGLVLSSPHKQFGGLSSLRVAADGSRFLAVTDRGFWVRGRITYRGEAPTGIADGEIAPMLYSDGRPITARGWYDAEALAEDGGFAYVALERVHRILKFDYAKRGLLSRGTLVPALPEIAKLPSNLGLECLQAMPKGSSLAGALVAISERGLDDAHNIRGFLIGGPKPGVFSVKRSDDFDVADCAVAPNSQLLVLERSFSWRRGVAMRIRSIPLADVVSGAVLEGTKLISADMGFEIDNMEGLSVSRTAKGETVLTLVSDDNFSMIQRTILLQFTLLDRDGASASRN
ncbi:esterase-like activity of phytase family protein [Pseudorhodoplanes sinuspersici]|uniref:esterase-like activity of phytase family protein n=1 Tax=Pseudorhodoplanes sinuspersici TaxID=1235591 RepID=UPI001FD8E615|nr:esterase-like activity of phytase family protein [Pseudorhodoplanes sinuspersici]